MKDKNQKNIVCPFKAQAMFFFNSKLFISIFKKIILNHITKMNRFKQRIIAVCAKLLHKLMVK